MVLSHVYNLLLSPKWGANPTLGTTDAGSLKQKTVANMPIEVNVTWLSSDASAVARCTKSINIIWKWNCQEKVYSRMPPRPVCFCVSAT